MRPTERVTGNLLAIGLIALMPAIEGALLQAPIVTCPACKGVPIITPFAISEVDNSNSSYAALGLRGCGCRHGRVSILDRMRWIPRPEDGRLAYLDVTVPSPPVGRKLKARTGLVVKRSRPAR